MRFAGIHENPNVQNKQHYETTLDAGGKASITMTLLSHILANAGDVIQIVSKSEIDENGQPKVLGERQFDMWSPNPIDPYCVFNIGELEEVTEETEPEAEKENDDITPFLGQYEHDGVTFQNGVRVTLRMIITENYIRLPNNGVNQMFYDSYEVDGNTLTLHLREVDWDYIITLRNRNQMILQRSGNNDKQVWLRVPSGQEWDEWGEIYDH